MKQPNILYTAVKALIKNSEGKVLVLRQSDVTITGRDTYHPPSGIVELGESLRECIIREIKEEIGVESKPVRLFDVGEWYAERGADVMQFIGIFYVCEIANDNFELQLSEVESIRWVGLEDIDSIEIIEPSRTIIKDFLSSF